MNKDDINYLFDKKLLALQDTIEKIAKLIGTEPPKIFFPFAMIMLIQNIRDLYGLNKMAFNVMLEVREELEYIKDKPNIETEIENLKKRFDGTFGKLERRLNKINAKDDEEKEKGDNPFYG
jgi:predicted ribosome quality control (RQC) complex YloA/Tae2 family protein